MTSSKSWICNGIAKDRKEYSGLGGAHEPHENYSPDCEICGLPRESQESPAISLIDYLSTRALMIVVIAGILAMVGGVAAYTFIAKGCEPGLEKIDDQCIDPFLQPYQEAKLQGDEAINLASNYQTIEDLERAELTLSNAITQLSQIPSEALIYQEVKTELEGYKTKKEEINSNWKKEKAAKDKLEEIKNIVQVAKSKTDAAKTTSQLAAAKQKWEDAKNKLKEISSTRLITSFVEKYRSDCNQHIKSIDERIALIARQNSSPRPSNTYKTPVKNYRGIKRRSSPPRSKTKIHPKKSTPSDPCADSNQSSNCLF